MTTLNIVAYPPSVSDALLDMKYVPPIAIPADLKASSRIRHDYDNPDHIMKAWPGSAVAARLQLPISDDDFASMLSFEGDMDVASIDCLKSNFVAFMRAYDVLDLLIPQQDGIIWCPRSQIPEHHYMTHLIDHLSSMPIHVSTPQEHRWLIRCLGYILMGKSAHPKRIMVIEKMMACLFSTLLTVDRDVIGWFHIRLLTLCILYCTTKSEGNCWDPIGFVSRHHDALHTFVINALELVHWSLCKGSSMGLWQAQHAIGLFVFLFHSGAKPSLIRHPKPVTEEQHMDNEMDRKRLINLIHYSNILSDSLEELESLSTDKIYPNPIFSKVNNSLRELAGELALKEETKGDVDLRILYWNDTSPDYQVIHCNRDASKMIALLPYLVDKLFKSNAQSVQDLRSTVVFGQGLYFLNDTSPLLATYLLKGVNYSKQSFIFISVNDIRISISDLCETKYLSLILDIIANHLTHIQHDAIELTKLNELIDKIINVVKTMSKVIGYDLFPDDADSPSEKCKEDLTHMQVYLASPQKWIDDWKTACDEADVLSRPLVSESKSSSNLSTLALVSNTSTVILSDTDQPSPNPSPKARLEKKPSSPIRIKSPPRIIRQSQDFTCHFSLPDSQSQPSDDIPLKTITTTDEAPRGQKRKVSSSSSSSSSEDDKYFSLTQKDQKKEVSSDDEDDNQVSDKSVSSGDEEEDSKKEKNDKDDDDSDKDEEDTDEKKEKKEKKDEDEEVIPSTQDLWEGEKRQSSRKRKVEKPFQMPSQIRPSKPKRSRR